MRAQMWKEQVTVVSISRLHLDVSDAMNSMGLAHENEGLTDDALFSVDIVARAQRVAVEVDGPFHFAANTLRSMGKLQAKLAASCVPWACQPRSHGHVGNAPCQSPCTRDATIFSSCS